MSSLCQNCQERDAVIFITQITDNETTKVRLCEECARAKSYDDDLISEIVEQLGEGEELTAIVDSTTEGFSDQGFDEVGFESEVPDSFTQIDPFDDDVFDPNLAYAELELDPLSGDDPFENIEVYSALPDEVPTRCSACQTTWERIKTDGRCGCSQCYATFREQLVSVMAKVQRGPLHVGKTPTEAEKRRLRQENLRKRHENQLQMLQNRLKEAVAAEKYEEAARLRDKIKDATVNIE
jgi:protein-arginine kinase activator protein McsA